MSKLSRRALVASTAAVPVLAIPALTADVNNPDAELLELGQRLELVEQDWSKQRSFDAACRAAQKAACTRAGLPDIEFPSSGSEQALQDWLAYQAKRESVPYEGKEKEEADVDSGGASIAWNEIHGRMFDLIDEILSYKPTTKAGIAVQARAVALEHAEWWDDPDNEHFGVCVLVESLCAFCGILPAPLRQNTREV